jgi:hypothetical protein
LFPPPKKKRKKKKERKKQHKSKYLPNSVGKIADLFSAESKFT